MPKVYVVCGWYDNYPLAIFTNLERAKNWQDHHNWSTFIHEINIEDCDLLAESKK